MSAKVSIVDKGLAKLTAQLAEMRRLEIVAGVQGPRADAPHPRGDGKSVAYIAAVHEYGSHDGRVPPRPFLRHTGEVSASRNRERLRKAVADVIDGRLGPVEAFAQVGEALVDEIRDTIDRANAWARPLAPSTVKRKGHDRVLRDTETMKRSVTFTVRDGGRVLRSG